MTTFRNDQPLAWTYHRGTARVLLDTPQMPTPQHGPGRETRRHRGSRCHLAYRSRHR